MAVNIFKDEMQHAELFGKPVLTTNWLISRETVPDGWFCYDMRGTKSDPGAHAELVDYTGIYYFRTERSEVILFHSEILFLQTGKQIYSEFIFVVIVISQQTAMDRKSLPLPPPIFWGWLT